MTTIFRDGRGFVPTTIFVPQFIDYHVDFHSEIQLPAKNNIIQTQNTDCIQSQMSPSDIHDIREHASQTFEKLFKHHHDNSLIIHHHNPTDDLMGDPRGDENDIFKMTFNQLAEKRLRNNAENEYNNFIAKREERIRSEQKRLLDIENYNREFNEKLAESKQRAAEKKRQEEDRLQFLKGLLLGDKDDPSIPKPTLSILQGIQTEFFKIWIFKAYHVHAVDKIYPIEFGYGGGYYRPLRVVSIKCQVKPRKQMVYAGIYRSWCNQFVRKIIEKRQRGPPCFFIK